MVSEEKYKKAWAEIIARAWSDEKFKKHLFQHTDEVLKEYGIPLEKGKHCKIIEESPKTVTLVFPRKPEGLSDEDLKKAAAGGEGKLVAVVGRL